MKTWEIRSHTQGKGFCDPGDAGQDTLKGSMESKMLNGGEKSGHVRSAALVTAQLSEPHCVRVSLQVQIFIFYNQN